MIHQESQKRNQMPRKKFTPHDHVADAKFAADTLKAISTILDENGKLKLSAPIRLVVKILNHAVKCENAKIEVRQRLNSKRFDSFIKNRDDLKALLELARQIERNKIK